jgi:hypothetical protein
LWVCTRKVAMPLINFSFSFLFLALVFFETVLLALGFFYRIYPYHRSEKHLAKKQTKSRIKG